MQVNILEAKNRLSQLIKSAQRGEEVIIANRGEPVARLIAAKGSAASAPVEGSANSILDWLHANPLPAHLQCSHEEIQAGIDEERAAWD